MVERLNRMKNDQVMATQRLAKSGRAANLSRLLAILAIFLEIQTSNLFCPSFPSIVVGKPIFRPIGLKIAILSHKNQGVQQNLRKKSRRVGIQKKSRNQVGVVLKK